MSNTTILGVKLENRTENATQLQEVLSKYGCSIKTRIGLHDVESGKCSTSGVILLEIIGSDSEKQEFEASLQALNGVDVKKMVL